MCRRSELVGLLLITAGATLLFSVVIPRGVIGVLLGIVFIGCGCLICRKR